MLHSLLPKAHPKCLALPLLGSIADGFDDWLAVNGYTPGSRRFAIRMLPHVDADLGVRARCRHDSDQVGRSSVLSATAGNSAKLSRANSARIVLIRSMADRSRSKIERKERINK
jgi:hypothetical protein